MLMATKFYLVLSAGVLVLAAGCSREPETVSTDQRAPMEQEAAAVDRAEPAVQNLRVSATPDSNAGASTGSVPAGDPLYVTMDVQGVSGQTPVTVHWYGPGGQPIAYETKTADSGNEQLSFTVENTHDWQSGQYRAEVWIGAQKAGEQVVQISDRDPLSASVDDAG
jgi:hypothetical protein